MIKTAVATALLQTDSYSVRIIMLQKAAWRDAIKTKINVKLILKKIPSMHWTDLTSPTGSLRYRLQRPTEDEETVGVILRSNCPSSS